MKNHIKKGFTLLEVSIVLLIVAMMLGLSAQLLPSTTSQVSCVVSTRQQLETIKGAIEKHVRNKGLYPRPAGRSLSDVDTFFGRAAATAASGSIDRLNSGAYAAQPVLFGALPFQALGLSSAFGSDCWGNKISYVVSENLTIDDATYTANSGNIIIKTGNLTTNSVILPNAAYAVIIHGKNGFGTVRRKYNGASHQWCSVGTGVESENCDIGNNIIFDSSYNDGEQAGALYFDDFVGYAGKSPINSTCTFNATTINDGESITAYSAASVPCGQSCATVSEIRTCSGGVLSGSITIATCTAQACSCMKSPISWTFQNCSSWQWSNSIW
jgi:prepilin-type N-terminal cleavage/methylation domain-containing protein